MSAVPFTDYPTIDAAKESLRKVSYQEEIQPIPKLDLDFEVNEKNKVKMRLAVGNNLLPMSRTAIRSLAKRTGISISVLREYGTDSDLVKSMMRHSLNKRSGELMICHDRDKVLNFYRPDSIRLNPMETFDICTGQSDLTRLERLSVDNSGKFEFCFLTDTAMNPPKRVGEASHAGLFVSSNGHVEVASYVLTLSCVNGLRTPRVSSKKIDSRDQLLERVTTAIVDKVAESKLLLELLTNRLDNFNIENPVGYVTNLFKRLKINNRTSQNLLTKASSLPVPCTAYDVVQMVTAMSNLTGRHVYQDVGFKVASSFEEPRCNSCGSVV